MQKAKVPMKRTKVFTEQVNTKITPELMDKVRMLKGLGVDLGALYRDAITKAVEDAFSNLQAS